MDQSGGRPRGQGGRREWLSARSCLGKKEREEVIGYCISPSSRMGQSGGRPRGQKKGNGGEGMKEEWMICSVLCVCTCAYVCVCVCVSVHFTSQWEERRIAQATIYITQKHTLRTHESETVRGKKS